MSEQSHPAIPSPAEVTPERIAAAGDIRQRLLEAVAGVIVGQTDIIDQMLVAMLCRAHCLVVGVPGLAKTLIVKTLGQLCDLSFRRVQFTPDLMPSDILGTEILREREDGKGRDLVFLKGPIFANLLLADEINRTPPKTQSALLEAMQEYHVTSGGTTYPLPAPFFVMATQNPIEQEGTYPLPEAQLDRFMFNLLIDYPSAEEEEQIVEVTTSIGGEQPSKVITAEQLLTMQEVVRQVPVSRHVVRYATRLVRSTRPRDPSAPPFVRNWVSWGCGPRAAQALILGAKARSLLDGRVNVSCEDVSAMVASVFRHRIFTNFNADAEGATVEDIVRRLLAAVKEPEPDEY